MSKIVVMDELWVEGARAREVRALYIERYAPSARKRGMELAFALIDPPVALNDGSNRLTFVWTLPDLPTWWDMRIKALMDPEVIPVWQELDSRIQRRSRSFHATEADDV